MPPSDSRILLFVILRSQKRLTITAGKVVDLTLEGFTSVRRHTLMNVLFFYLYLLHQLYILVYAQFFRL